MMRVGNDVVDLGDPQIAEHHLRPRFVARVCSEEERGRVRDARSLWSLFASKEAAYKVLMKLGFEPGFGHREIVVAEDLRSVRWRDVSLHLRVEATDDRVHAVAWEGEAEPSWGAEQTGDRDLSAAARALLCAALAREGRVSMLTRTVSVVRDPRQGSWDGFGPPRVVSRGEPLDVDVSLSHDGRFAAYAALAV